MPNTSHPAAVYAVDPAFLALPLDMIADAAITTARSLGASWVDLRVEGSDDGWISLRDTDVDHTATTSGLSLGVRVIVDGTWGFASDPRVSVDGAVCAVHAAVKLARVARPLTGGDVRLSDEAVIGTATWTSDWRIDPFTVPEAEKRELLTAMAAGLLSAAGVDHVDTSSQYVKEKKFYADSSGNRLTSQRVRIETALTATSIDPTTGRVTTLRTLAQPTARGWEYMLGDGFDWTAELAALPELLAQKAAAPSLTPGRYDLVIHPSQLWLTIHESIGHATELDRVLGFEANYAGTTFAALDMPGRFRYGTELLNVTGDRTAAYGLASVGFDDEGVATRSFPLITDGILQTFQMDRSSALLAGFEHSNGCAYADGAGNIPLQRMPNISMQPADDGPSLGELIAGIDDGVYVVGDNSWSIDMQRHNFQFTGQQFWRIRDGRLDGQLRDIAYQSSTAEFWGSLTAVGGPETYLLGGALNCGKGQPGQSAPVSHGAPAARFDRINIINVGQEA
jgi:TldD protein